VNRNHDSVPQAETRSAGSVDEAFERWFDGDFARAEERCDGLAVCMAMFADSLSARDIRAVMRQAWHAALPAGAAASYDAIEAVIADHFARCHDPETCVDDAPHHHSRWRGCSLHITDAIVASLGENKQRRLVLDEEARKGLYHLATSAGRVVILSDKERAFIRAALASRAEPEEAKRVCERDAGRQDGRGCFERDSCVSCHMRLGSNRDCVVCVLNAPEAAEGERNGA
jgi:hypothetical protein